ncbi:MAG: hypothetical protein H0V82_08880 [Candidatus Protochlamydia sp.]|nr:hypothetical protein [Candidatus Protochlamydia sp.]
MMSTNIISEYCYYPEEAEQGNINQVNQVVCIHENILAEIFDFCAVMPSKLCSNETLLTVVSRVCKGWKKAAYLCAKKRMIDAPFLYKCGWSHKTADSEIEFAGKHQILGLDLTKYNLEDRHLKELIKKVTNLCCLSVIQPHVWGFDPVEKQAKEITEWPVMPSLKTLKLGGYPSAKICADLAKNCTKLQNICLLASYINNNGIKELAKCPNLEEINLQAVKVSAIAFFADSPKLRKMNLLGTLVTDQELSSLAKSKTIEEINLENTKVGNDGISSLYLCKNLRKLKLNHSLISDEALIHLSKSSSLEKLDISGTPISDRGLAALALCSTLRKLTFCDSTRNHKISAKGILSLVSSNLEVVSFTQLNLGRGGFKDFSKIKTLREIDLTSSEVDDDTLFDLANCKNLQVIKFSGNDKFITEEGISALIKNNTLIKLDYLGNHFTDKIAQEFPFSKIEVLYIRRSVITDVGLKALATSQTLRELVINLSMVSDAGFLELINCESLSRLTLHDAKISKESVLAFIRNKKNLIEIQLKKTILIDKEISEVIKIIADERPNLKISISNY